MNLTLGTLQAMRLEMEAKLKSPAYDNPSQQPLLHTFFGMPVLTSPFFPFISKCDVCEGTGEGTTSTYCQRCKGQGSTKFVGSVSNGPQQIMLTEPMEKAFEPHWPTDVLVPLREI